MFMKRRCRRKKIEKGDEIQKAQEMRKRSMELLNEIQERVGDQGTSNGKRPRNQSNFPNWPKKWHLSHPLKAPSLPPYKSEIPVNFCLFMLMKSFYCTRFQNFVS